MKQQYAVPSELGTTYIVTDNPPVGGTLVQDHQSQQPVGKPSLEQRIEVLEKAVSNINERLGIKTNGDTVDLDAAYKSLDSLDSSATIKATNEIANTGATNATTVAAEPTAPSSSASAAAEPVTPSSSASAPIPSADDIAKQLGDLT